MILLLLSTMQTKHQVSTREEGQMFEVSHLSLRSQDTSLTQAHLSKDLIFVVSDGHLEGVSAWSSAYFGSIPNGLTVDPVRAGGSQVWNAISLDYPADSFSSLVVQYEGFDGQRPTWMSSTLSFVSLTAWQAACLSALEIAPPSRTSKIQFSVWQSGGASRCATMSSTSSVTTRTAFALHCVKSDWRLGQASGPHGFFQRHHVDAGNALRGTGHRTVRVLPHGQVDRIICSIHVQPLGALASLAVLLSAVESTQIRAYRNGNSGALVLVDSIDGRWHGHLVW